MVYFDTSFIAPLLFPEATSKRIEAFVRKMPAGSLAVSHWTRIEFASLTGRRVRMGELTESQASHTMSVFERLLADSYQVISPTVADCDAATRLLQHYRMGLRAGDALHLAIAQNHDAEVFYTLDERLIKAATTANIRASGLIA